MYEQFEMQDFTDLGEVHVEIRNQISTNDCHPFLGDCFWILIHKLLTFT